MVLPAPLWPTSPIISPGLNFEIYILQNGPAAVVETHVAEFHLAAQPAGMHGMRGFGHAGHAVEDGKNPLRAGCRPLHGRDHAAHRIHAQVKSADGGDKHNPQFANIDFRLE